MKYLLPLPLLLVACTSDSSLPEDSLDIIQSDPFCESYAEAGSQNISEGTDPTSSSGRVFGQLVTGVGTDPFDPNFVSFVDYILENTVVGGAPTVGRTDGDGHFTESLGPGSWHVKTSGHQGVYYCAVDQHFTVEAGKLTRICADMNCE